MKEATIKSSMLQLLDGDISRQQADAIVTAANAALAGGGGVDGAIHRAGGPSIQEECRRIGGCRTGEAVITGAGLLQARYVIHAVAPIYRNGRTGEAALLRSAYRASLEVAEAHGVRSLALPSLGTGAYRFPLPEAAWIALSTVVSYLRGDTALERITFVLYGTESYTTFERTLDAVLSEPSNS